MHFDNRDPIFRSHQDPIELPARWLTGPKSAGAPAVHGFEIVRASPGYHIEASYSSTLRELCVGLAEIAAVR
jgi:hypothetical protein